MQKKHLVIILLIVLLMIPRLTFAEGDYEEGDGWTYLDGTLTISDNGGLIDFVSNDKDEQTGEWKYQHSFEDVENLVIGKDVTWLVNEIYEWNQIAPKKTIIEAGNDCFVIENGWVINTITKTLYGAANVPEKQQLVSINDLPDYIVHIGDGAFFNYRNMTSILLPQSIESIGNCSFMWCIGLTSVAFPERLQIIGFKAFEDCDLLEQIHLDKQILTVGFAAFTGCNNIELFDIRQSKLTNISFNLFGACYKMQSIELPETATTIEPLAFRICYALHTLIINSSGITIEDQAFDKCDNLSQIIFTKGTPESFGETLFGELGKTADGRYYISHDANRNNKPIPYPTLLYTAAYADEWAPNGETEWNGYPIDEISQDQLNAIVALSRGEPFPTPIATPAPTALPEAATTTDNTSYVGVLLAGLIVVVGAAVVAVGAAIKRKGKKTES